MTQSRPSLGAWRKGAAVPAAVPAAHLLGRAAFPLRHAGPRHLPGEHVLGYL